MNGVIRKDDFSGLVAVSSKLGWLVSGPVRSDGERVTSTNLTHVFKIESFSREGYSLLNDQVKMFWELDTLGIKEKEISVYDKFLDDIKFKMEDMKFVCRSRKGIQS